MAAQVLFCSSAFLLVQNHLENSVILRTDKAWRNGKRNIPHQVFWLVFAQRKTERQKISIYVTWDWPRTSKSQPKHSLLSLLLGALGPGWPVHPWPVLYPWMKAPWEPNAVRLLHRKIRHMSWDSSREGVWDLHLFPTAPSMSHRTTTPHSNLFLWKKDVIVNVKSYKMVQNLVFAKTNHGRVLLFLFLCSRTSDSSPWGIILQVRAPQNSRYLYCGICWHVWGLAPGLHGVCMQETEQPSDCGGKQDAEKHDKSLSVVLWACVLYCAIFP